MQDNRATAAEPALPIITLDKLSYSWSAGLEPLLVIDHLAVEPGEKVFIKGPSGSGKSTLLNLLAGFLVPQQGEVKILDQRMTSMTGASRDRFRADHIGVIFQMFNLIPYLSLTENVTLPCRFSARKFQQTVERGGGPAQEAKRLLRALNLADPELLSRQVTDLSVGQQQRVAAGRALIGSPDLVIADEPTSSLDMDQRESFLELLFDECSKSGATLVFVSHDASLAPLFHRVVDIRQISKANGSGERGS